MKKNQNQILIQFEPAQLYRGSTWYIQYKVINPYTKKLIQKRIKCNRIKNLKEREKFAKHIIKEINSKLYSGWNPFIEDEAPKSFTRLLHAFNTFLKIKKRELRKDSMRSYNSYFNIIKEWMFISDNIDCYCVNFKKKEAIDFMNHSYNERNISTLTYNNYLVFYKTLFNWLREQQYTNTNPFEGMKRKKKKKKTRTILTHSDRLKIKEYLQDHDYDFYIVTLLVYHALIRPKEITYLKPENFNFKNQTIYIEPEAAKNGNSRTITIPNVLMNELVSYNFNNAKTGEYIFSQKFKPGTTLLDARKFTRKWSNMRLKLNLSKSIQFYSLRDTGIVQMFEDGISADEIMKQADHSSLEITSIYAKHYNVKGSEVIKKNVSGF
mgnify:CR=1 FL=1